MKKILITKNSEDAGELLSFCNCNNLKVEYHSFISFQQQSIKVPEDYPIFFFSSKRAVHFFLKQHEIPSKTRIACIGNSTYDYLNELNYKIDFVGNNPGDPNEVGIELEKWSNGDRIVLISSSETNYSVSDALHNSQFTFIHPYKTILNSVKLKREFDYIIFTSPSNVNGFLRFNEIKAGTKVIAWGKTTEKELVSLGYQPEITLKKASENEVVDYLKSLNELN